MDLSDEQIVQAIHREDQKVFRAIFDHYFQRMYLTAMKLVHEPDVAEDVVHEVFVSLWNRSEPLNLYSSFEGYLYRSVRNRSLNHLSKKYVNTETALEEQVFRLSDNDLSDENLKVKELGELVQQALSLMPETTRLVFSLSRFDDKKYQEIADHLGCTVKNVEYHMGKSLKYMRTYLKKYGYVLLLLHNFS